MTTPTPSNSGRTIKIYGQPNSPEAYEIRDFLNRSNIEFAWVELTSDEDCQTQLGKSTLEDVQLPVVDFPDEHRLFAPSLEDIAQRLGWVTKPKFKEYDLSIYGAGPAGLSAAVYAASEGLRTILIEREAIGGQAGTSSLIENYMGFPEGISGAHLAERARQQAVKFGIEILLLREGVKATFENNRIYVDMADGDKMVARANICATGVEYRRLNLENEDNFLNRGVFYGAGASEASMCKEDHVYVVGGGNSAGQAAMYFSEYAEQVTMLVRGSNLADSLSEYLIKKIESNDNINVLFHSEVTDLIGEKSLEQIEITNNKEETTRQVDTQKLFICIGGAPNTDWAKDTNIIRDKSGYLVTGSDLLKAGKPPEVWTLDREPFYLETSVPGSFAAGDVRRGSVKRVASAVGEGAMAVTFVHKYLGETQ